MPTLNAARIQPSPADPNSLASPKRLACRGSHCREKRRGRGRVCQRSIGDRFATLQEPAACSADFQIRCIADFQSADRPNSQGIGSWVPEHARHRMQDMQDQFAFANELDTFNWAFPHTCNSRNPGISGCLARGSSAGAQERRRI